MRYRFDGFVLDTDRVELSRNGSVIPTEPKTFDLLHFLLENRDRVVSKDEIFDHIWPGVFVSDASISSALKQVRQAVNDSGEAQAVIRTVRGKGFRFVADLEPAEGSLAPAVSAVPQPQMTRRDGPPTIAVLPFVRLASNATHDALADALPAEIISALSRLRSLRVIARGSSFRFDATKLDHEGIRQRLGVDYLLSGSIELSGNRLTVVPELSETNAGHIVWGDRFSGPLDEIFSVRQSIVRQVCNAVEMAVPIHEADRLAEAPTEDLTAWGHYHVGLRNLLWNRGTQNDLATLHLRKALALDPRFARAHAALAFAELEAHNFETNADGAANRIQGMELAEKAVDLDPQDPFCNLVLSRAHWVSRDLEGAIGWAGRSVELNHNYAFGHYELGKFNAIACLGGDAETYAATAMSLSPLDPNVSGMLSARALAAYVRGDMQQALQFADASMRAPNRHLFVCGMAAAIYTTQGKLPKAERAVARAAGWNSDFTLARFEQLFTLKDQDKHQELVRAFRQLGLE